MKKLEAYYQDYQLTNSQRQAIEQIADFLSSDSHVFILKGYAGTGKTFMLSKIALFLEQFGVTSIFAAPTGRAAKVLHEKSKEKTSTIHSLIYQFDLHRSVLEEHEEEDNDQADQLKLVFGLRKNDDQNRTLYVFDEASMISDQQMETEDLFFGSGKLLTDVINYTEVEKSNRKLIFIGDNAQLPPVNCEYSPALSEDYLTEQFGLKCMSFEMKDVYRQKIDSGVLQTSLTLRQALEADRFDTLSISPNGKDLHEIQVWELPNLFVNYRIPGNEQEIIAIVQSNAKVFRQNQLIREKLGYPEHEIVSGEQLLVIKNTVATAVKQEEDTTTETFLNGDFIHVIKSDPNIEERYVGIKKIKEPVILRFKTIQAYKYGANGEKQFFTTKIILNPLYHEQRGLSKLEYRALLIDFQNRTRIKMIDKELFIEALLRDPYYNALQVKFGYAVTCHKSQGGEWKRVAVDFKVAQNYRTESYYRWAYTAITRTKETLYLLSPPHFQAIALPQEIEDQFERLLDAFIDDGAIDIISKIHNYQYQFHMRWNTKEIRFHVYFDKFGIITKPLRFHPKTQSAYAATILQELEAEIMDVLHPFMKPEKADPQTIVQLKKELRNRFLQSLLDYQVDEITMHHYLLKLFLSTRNQRVVVNIHYNDRGKFTKHTIQNGHEHEHLQLLQVLRHHFQMVT